MFDQAAFDHCPYVASNVLGWLLGFKTLSAVRRWAKRHGIVAVQRDGRNLYDLRDVRTWVERHASTVRPVARPRSHGCRASAAHSQVC